MVAAFQPTERETGASSTLLLDRMVVAFRPDGSYVREVHQVRRLNDQAGVAAHEEARAAADADEVIRLRTILPDGTSVVPKRVAGSFAMPRLAPGAFVEELWTERVDGPGAQRRQRHRRRERERADRPRVPAGRVRPRAGV